MPTDKKNSTAGRNNRGSPIVKCEVRVYYYEKIIKLFFPFLTTNAKTIVDTVIVLVHAIEKYVVYNLRKFGIDSFINFFRYQFRNVKKCTVTKTNFKVSIMFPIYLGTLKISVLSKTSIPERYTCTI